MFVTGVTKDIKVGQNGEIDVTIKKLSWKQLKKANRGAQKDAVESAREAGAELVKAFRELAKAEAAGEVTPEVKRKARYGQYDMDYILFNGIKSWSAPQEVTSEAIDTLEPAIAEQIHEAILDFSLPPLELGVAMGKDLTPSTVS